MTEFQSNKEAYKVIFKNFNDDKKHRLDSKKSPSKYLFICKYLSNEVKCQIASIEFLNSLPNNIKYIKFRANFISMELGKDGDVYDLVLYNIGGINIYNIFRITTPQDVVIFGPDSQFYIDLSFYDKDLKELNDVGFIDTRLILDIIV